MDSYITSSESVGAGHPDKLCDKVSDAILDHCLKYDPESRVACETMAKNNNLILGGEITSEADLSDEALGKIVRDAIVKIGYTDKAYGINGHTCNILNLLGRQSPDISQGVTEGEGDFKEQGAGDQGCMWGYACNETSDLMPLSIVVAHRLVKKIAEVREEGVLPYLRPDCKSQVAVRKSHGSVTGLENVVIAAQHDSDVSMERLRKDIKKYVIDPICGKLLLNETEIFINATGRFEIGGPQGDCGLTGRKIIIDTYGAEVGLHGGGAFSGKDPSKVDRSAAYAARYIAKNIVAAGLAKECKIELAYCIGVAKNTSITLELDGKKANDIPVQAIKDIFPLKPAETLSHFSLKEPKGWCYYDTAAYGHFGREEFPWEKTDKAKELKKALKGQKSFFF